MLNHPNTKRTSHKLSSEEEIDARRARGEISCAECRRLKLKCDKKLPCSSCIRRGCPSICPNGSLSTGQGTRFVLADTTQLHAKISEMGQRIRQLEDALAIFQSGVSSETHPLLREELLAIKFGPEKSYISDKQQPTRRSSFGSTIDALGTMTIGDRGDGKYFGPSAGSETLLLAGAELGPPPEVDDLPPVSIEIAKLSAGYLFGADENVDEAMDLLFENLPNQLRAWALCETYMEQASWAFRPIRRDELIDELLSPTYKALKERKSVGSHNISSHKLAVLYFVFALGALVDLTLEPFNKEAESYYHLGRACLSLRSIFDSPEIATVQAVLLLAAYHGMAGKRYTIDSLWALTSLGAKLAQSLGLHRDSARWNMESKIVQRRRALFWELVSAELFYSLMLGRPPSIRLSYVDCEFPIDDEATIDADGNTLVGYFRWKYEFTKEILASVLELTLTATAPHYQTILDLDRKVREKTLPPHLNVFMNPEDEHYTPSVYMRRCLLGQYRSVTLLYIHRSFFAQAMLDHPVNPLRSPYAPSFLAAYRCASGVIKSSLNHFDRFPELCARWWGIWTHLFSAAVIVGCIVTRSPSSGMASSAFIELGLACDLFEKGAVQSLRARSGLAILYRMRQRAFQVYSQYRSGNVTPIGGILSVGKPDYGDDELALFGGQTRVLVSKLISSRSCKRESSASSPARTSTTNHPSPDSDSRSSEMSPDVHPSLVEYLSKFPPQYPQNNNPSHSLETLASQPPMYSGHFQHIDVDASSSNTYSHEAGKVQTSEQEQVWGNGNWQLPTQNTNFLHSHKQQSNSQQYSPHLNIYPTVPGVPVQGTDSKSDSPASLGDLGMMVSGESAMDEQWMSFMRDSGILGGNAYMMSTSHIASNGSMEDSRENFQ